MKSQKMIATSLTKLICAQIKDPLGKCCNFFCAHFVLTLDNAISCLDKFATHVSIYFPVPGLQQQGIFRVPGSQVEVNDIKNSFERG